MTDLLDDSSNPTNYIQGAESQTWTHLIDQHDLIDLIFCVARWADPYFTRQMLVGQQLDQSRLDYIYASHQGAWFSYVSSLVHDTSLALFDHYLVLLCLVLTNQTPSFFRKSIYLKMDASYLNNPIFKKSIQEAWVSPLPDQDPRLFLGTRVEKDQEGNEQRKAMPSTTCRPTAQSCHQTTTTLSPNPSRLLPQGPSMTQVP